MRLRFLAASAAALAVADPHAQTFKTSAELVTVPVTVTSRDGHTPIGGLTADDFRVLEDGVAQTITLVDRERRPVSLCIVLDSSNSMAGKKQQLAAATVDRVLAGLRPEDEASLVVFTGTSELAMPWTPARDVPQIEWTKWKAAGWTALIDGLKRGIELLGNASNPKPVVLVVSDGGEAGSFTPFSQLVTTRRQSEALVYAVHTDAWLARQDVSPGGPLGPTVASQLAINVLPGLVGDSGGAVYTVQIDPQASRAAQTFLEELQSQYTLGYVPTRAPDGKYRRVKVETKDKTFKVRHRGGYLAMPR